MLILSYSVSENGLRLTAVFLGQQRVEVQLQTAAGLSRPRSQEVLRSAAGRVQRPDGAPVGGVQLWEVRGQTLPHQEDVEVPDSSWRSQRIHNSDESEPFKFPHGVCL